MRASVHEAGALAHGRVVAAPQPRLARGGGQGRARVALLLAQGVVV